MVPNELLGVPTNRLAELHRHTARHGHLGVKQDLTREMMGGVFGPHHPQGGLTWPTLPHLGSVPSSFGSNGASSTSPNWASMASSPMPWSSRSSRRKAP